MAFSLASCKISQAIVDSSDFSRLFNH
jgi:hypothetical protein